MYDVMYFKVELTESGEKSFYPVKIDIKQGDAYTINYIRISVPYISGHLESPVSFAFGQWFNRQMNTLKSRKNKGIRKIDSGHYETENRKSIKAIIDFFRQNTVPIGTMEGEELWEKKGYPQKK